MAKKRWFFIGAFMVGVLSLLVMVPGSYATPVSVGDEIYFKKGSGRGDADFYFAGELEVYKKSNNNYLFTTFCLEINEDIYLGDNNTYDVYDISDTAYAGGEENPASDPIYGDRLDYTTAYLFYHFFNSSLSYQDYTYGTDADEDAHDLQYAIWYFEDEISSIDSENRWYQAAKANATPAYKALAMNLKVHGSKAIAQSHGAFAAVPEPETMMLLGSGLLLLAGFGRRKFGKK